MYKTLSSGPWDYVGLQATYRRVRGTFDRFCTITRPEKDHTHEDRLSRGSQTTGEDARKEAMLYNSTSTGTTD